MLTSIQSVLKNYKKSNEKELQKKRLSRSDECIMKIIYSISTKYHKTYCNPKLDTIIEILQTRYHIRIKQRTLRWHMRILEAKKYIVVRKKVTRLRTGQILGMPNIYFVTHKLRKFIKGIIKQSAIWVAKETILMKDLFKKFDKLTIEITEKVCIIKLDKGNNTIYYIR